MEKRGSGNFMTILVRLGYGMVNVSETCTQTLRNGEAPRIFLANVQSKGKLPLPETWIDRVHADVIMKNRKMEWVSRRWR